LHILITGTIVFLAAWMITARFDIIGRAITKLERLKEKLINKKDELER